MFLERLFAAIKDNNLDVVDHTLQAIQEYNKNHTVKIKILPYDYIEIEKKAKHLIYYALEKNIDIFKLLIRFFKENSDRLPQEDMIKENLIQIFYSSVVENKLDAVKFFVDEMEIDLLEKSNGFQPNFDSSLKFATYGNLDIFKYLIPHCISAYQDSTDKDVDKDLIQPALAHLNSLKNYHLISEEDCAYRIDLLTIYRDIAAIFSTNNNLLLTHHLAASYAKNKVVCIEVVGDFLKNITATLDNYTENELNEILYKSNRFLAIISDYIADENDSEKESLKSLLEVNILMPYFYILYSFKGHQKEQSEYKRGKFILEEYLNLAPPSYFEMPKPSKNLIPLSAPKKNEESNLSAAPDTMNPQVAYQLALLLYEMNDELEAIKIWGELAVKLHDEKSLKYLEELCNKRNDFKIRFKASLALGDAWMNKADNHNSATKRYLSALNVAISKPNYEDLEIEKVKMQLNILIKNNSVENQLRKKACITLIYYSVQHTDYQSASEWMSYGISTFGEIFFAEIGKIDKSKKNNFLTEIADATFQGKLGQNSSYDNKNIAAKIYCHLFESYHTKQSFLALKSITEKQDQATSWLPLKLAKKLIELGEYAQAIQLLEPGVQQNSQEYIQELDNLQKKIGMGNENKGIVFSKLIRKHTAIFEAKNISEQKKIAWFGNEDFQLYELASKLGDWFTKATTEHLESFTAGRKDKKISFVSIFKRKTNPTLLNEAIDFVNILFAQFSLWNANNGNHDKIDKKIKDYLHSLANVKVSCPLADELKGLLETYKPSPNVSPSASIFNINIV